MPLQIIDFDGMKKFLDENHHRYNNKDFIQLDPVSIPHKFRKKEDIEIAGFLTALISWGNRKSILRSAENIMALMNWTPFEFTISHSESDLVGLKNFVHRTMNGLDLITLVVCLKEIYQSGGLERIFTSNDLEASLRALPQEFFGDLEISRARKHVADISKGSAAKRINMFLRWMVRKDNSGVDFGIWKGIQPSQLYVPLDIHSGRVARELGLLNREQNDWRAVVELTESLREFDPNDPIKYDFALFGISAVGQPTIS